MEQKQDDHNLEVQQQEAVTEIAEMFLNSNEGDREKNVRAMADAFIVKYLEFLEQKPEADTSIRLECKRKSSKLRNHYSGIPKLLLDGIDIEGIGQVGPNPKFLLIHQIKNDTFEKTVKILDSIPNIDPMDLLTDTISAADRKGLSVGESINQTIKLGRELNRKGAPVEDFEIIVGEISSLVSDRTQEHVDKYQKEYDGYRQSTRNRYAEARSHTTDERRLQKLMENEEEELEEYDHDQPKEETLRKDMIYSAHGAIDYLIYFYPGKVLKRFEPHIKTKNGKEMLSSLLSGFQAFADSDLQSNVYYHENTQFFDDIILVLKQNVALTLDQIFEVKKRIKY